MSELELRDVVKRLGDHTAVDHLSFRVRSGEFLVLLGSSGCGKTTTLRMISGLERPDSGSILLDGRDITPLPPRERNLGMVFQEYGLYPGMDVRGNIAYGLEARGKLSKKEIEARVVAAARKLGLEDRLRSETQTMSGGEQQRVALARALVKDASAYLFDEPLSNLDPKLRHQARRDIMAVHREKTQPSVYVTHDQSEAFAMADTVAIMSHGRVQQVGTPTQLVDNPANVFVAQFVGSPPMNVLSGVIERGSADTVRTDIGRIHLSGRWTEAIRDYSKEQVLVGLRPTVARVGHDGDDPLTGEVVEAEFGLTELIVSLRAGAGAALVLQFEDDVEAIVGQQLRFGVDADSVLLFDVESQQALGG